MTNGPLLGSPEPAWALGSHPGAEGTETRHLAHLSGFALPGPGSEEQALNIPRLLGGAGIANGAGRMIPFHYPLSLQ